MLKIIGTDIVIRPFFTKTITWRSKKCPCLSAPKVVSKITGNPKNLTTEWSFWAQIKQVFWKLLPPTSVNLAPIYWYFLFVYLQKVVFTCVNPFFILFLFIIFIVLLPLSMNFKLNFVLNFNTMSLFHLNFKILFGFLPIKEQSFGLLERISKI